MNKENVKYIILHHSATKDGMSNDWEAIRKWHTGKTGSSNVRDYNYNPYVNKPMLDIGYHYGIEQIDNKYVLQTGRPVTMQGAHTRGFNDNSIGICIIGNFDIIEPTIEAICKLKELIVYCLLPTFTNVIDLTYVKCHWETFMLLGLAKSKDEAWIKFKTCPGKKFNMDAVRCALR